MDNPEVIRFKEELQQILIRLKEENNALLKLIRELNSQADDIISVSRSKKIQQNKPKTIKP